MSARSSAPVDTNTTPHVLSGWRYRAVIWSALLAAAGYLLVALWSGWQHVVTALAKVGLPGGIIALLLSLTNYGLRFVRWQLYLRAMGQLVPWQSSLRIYLAGFALTTTPGKAGEMVRSALLKPWRVPYSSSFAAFFSERLSDLFAVASLALIGLAAYPAVRPLVVAAIAILVTGVVILVNATLARRVQAMVTGSSRLASLARHVLDTLRQARRCHGPALLMLSTVLSLAAWCAEAWAFHLVLGWMGVQTSLTFAFFVYAASMLAGALSFMPGGLGGAEAMMVALLLWKGAAEGDAVAATVLIRLATLWLAVLLGAFAATTLRQPALASDTEESEMRP